MSEHEQWQVTAEAAELYDRYPARYILDADGAVLRPPLPGGEDVCGPTISRRMTGRRAQPRTQRQAQLIACAQAVAELAEHQEIQPLRVHDVEHDLEIHAVLGAIVRRWKTRSRSMLPTWSRCRWVVRSSSFSTCCC